MKKGFTFVEAIVSMMLLSITAIIILQVVASSIQNYNEALLRYQAAVGAQSLYEEFRAQLLLTDSLDGEDLYAVLQIEQEDFEAIYNGQRIEFCVTVNEDRWSTIEDLPERDADLSIQSDTPVLENVSTLIIVVDAYEKGTLTPLFRLVDVAYHG